MSLAAPAVSVIMPVFNRADVVGRAIASVLGQSFADFELIIVGDRASAIAAFRAEEPAVVTLDLGLPPGTRR